MPRPHGVRAVVRAALRDEWDGLERITRDLRAADLLTIANALLGMGAILWAIQGEALRAVGFVLLAVIVDGLDGQVARLRGGGGPLGGPLDALADAITFVAAAPLVAFLVLEPSAPPWAAVAMLAFYAAAGLLRLARFEGLRTDRPGPSRPYFSGLSSPGAALTLLALLLVDVPAEAVLSVALLTGVLMVSRVRYPKLRGAMGATAVAVILLVLLTPAWPVWQERAAWLLLGLMAVYVVVGPYYVLTRFGPTAAPEGDA